MRDSAQPEKKGRGADMNININDKIIYLGAGAGIGVVLGLLFAPQSGEQTRHDLTDRVDDLTHKVQEKISTSGIGDTATQTWNTMVEKGKNVASIGRQRLNESIEAGKRRFNESVEGEDMAER
jgi:gas vesicle protein